MLKILLKNSAKLYQSEQALQFTPFACMFLSLFSVCLELSSILELPFKKNKQTSSPMDNGRSPGSNSNFKGTL